MNRDDILSRLNLPGLVEETARYLLTHAAKGSLIGYEYGKHIGAADPDNFECCLSDGRPSEGLLGFARLRAKELIDEKIELLISKMDDNDGVINLYRGLVVNSDWLDGDITSRPAGLCWTWDYEFATSYNPDVYDDPIEVRLCGILEVDDVDWQTTILLNASELYNVGEEREARLKPTAVVEIFGVDWRPFKYYSTEKFTTDERFDSVGIHLCAGDTMPKQSTVINSEKAWFL